MYSNNVLYKMRVEARVLDIDQKTARSTISIFIKLGPLPYQFHETAIQVQILGGGDMMLTCEETARDSYGKYFEGNSSGSWYLIGAGELYPFDYYHLKFEVDPFIDMSFTMNEILPIFHGQKQRSLSDTWETTDTINELPYHVSENEGLELTVALKRRWGVPFLAFVLPVVLCYYFLGASLFMDPESRMREIRVVYLSLFVFVPMFFIGIQGFLPYRSLLSIPEILLTNLITSIALMGIFAMLSEYRKHVILGDKKLPLEWIGLILAILLFIGYYNYLLLPILFQSMSIETILTFLFVIGAYVLGAAGFVLRFNEHKAESQKESSGARFLICREI